MQVRGEDTVGVRGEDAVGYCIYDHCGFGQRNYTGVRGGRTVATESVGLPSPIGDLDDFLRLRLLRNCLLIVHRRRLLQE